MSNVEMKQTQPAVYPALHVIFTLLNAVRRGLPRPQLWREFRRQGIALRPRLAFWIPLCKQAGLLKETDGFRSHRISRERFSWCKQAGLLKETDGTLRVTSYAPAWLKKSPEEQTIALIEAWLASPRNKKARQFRKKLLWKLQYDKPLTAKDTAALNGLDALGLTVDHALTRWGRYFIKGEGKLPSPKPVSPCVIDGDQFVAHLPSHPHLLWQLELHLRPSAPGVYPLSGRILQQDVGAVFQLLEMGLQAELPARIKAVLLAQPSIRVMEGIVLEFSSPADLAQLRRQPVLRKYMEEFLSPQRVLVSNRHARALFALLRRRGVYLPLYEEQAPVRKKRTHFPQQQLLQPVGRSLPKLTILRKYQELGQALEMLYRAPGCTPEVRRITPLAIEQRGEHTYVIAYCQTRRGQRTFRLDRIEVPGTW